MKKFLSLLMAATLMVSVFVGFSVQSSAAVEWVEEVYEYNISQEEYGKEEPIFNDGIWMYEYYDPADGKFKMMQDFLETAKTDSATMASQGQCYIPFVEGIMEDGQYNYCLIRNRGTEFHPADGGTKNPGEDGARATLTFVVPADGKISYAATVTPNANSSGNPITLWREDTPVWPASGVDKFNIRAFLADKSTVAQVDAIIDVKAGDHIRLSVGSNGSKGSKVVTISDVAVTYLDATVPIGNPNGTPPANVRGVTKSSTDTSLAFTWDAAKDADGYNVYYKTSDAEEFTKANSEPIKELEYTIENLEPKTYYTIVVRTIKGENESDPSAEAMAQTKKASSDTPTTPTGSDSTTDTAPVSSGTTDKKGSLTWLWIVIAVVAVVVIAVVVVLVMKGKKKGEDAPKADDSSKTENK